MNALQAIVQAFRRQKVKHVLYGHHMQEYCNARQVNLLHPDQYYVDRHGSICRHWRKPDRHGKSKRSKR